MFTKPLFMTGQVYKIQKEMLSNMFMKWFCYGCN